MKTFLLNISLAVVILLSACSTVDQKEYYVDMDLPEEVRLEYISNIDENSKLFQETDVSETKTMIAGEIAFYNMLLGNFSESIKYYEIVLESSPSDFSALNNIADMYEQVGEIAKALNYEKRLYEYESENYIVIDDVIRLLLKNGQTEDALGVLETYAKTEPGKVNLGFVSEQFEKIRSEQSK